MKSSSLPPRNMLIAGGLLGFIALLWGASIFLRVETSEGTIIIEIDQPELAGAVVSVDGEKKVTIKTGEGNESITVEADGKSHKLKVVKGGFKAYVKEFTIKAGGEQTIKVRLEPAASKIPNDEKIVGGKRGNGMKAAGGTTYTPTEILASPDYEWTEPVNLGPGVNSAGRDGPTTLSSDGLTLMLNSNRQGGTNKIADIWQCTRTDLNAPWSSPVCDIGPDLARDSHGVSGASLSADGKTLYFSKYVDFNAGASDIYQCTRTGPLAPWSNKTKLPPSINSPGNDLNPQISADGKTLYFNSELLQRGGTHRLLTSTYDEVSEVWSQPVRPDFGLPADLEAYTVTLSQDGLLVLFGVHDRSQAANVNVKLWMATRSTPTGPFSNAHPLSSTINGEFDAQFPVLSADGTTLFFASKRPGGSGDLDIWMSRRVLKSSGSQPTPTTSPPPNSNRETSLYFDKLEDAVLIPSLTDKTDSLTFEVWLQRDRSRRTAHSHIIGFDHRFRLGTGAGSRYSFQADGIGTGIEAPSLPESGQLVHLAGVRDAETQEARLYENGKLVAKRSGKSKKGTGHLQICSNDYQWKGGNPATAPSFAGWIYEIRISSSAKYKADFTPQKRFSDDKDTLALYHFDTGTGDVLHDSSGNGHHGKITGAKWVKAAGLPGATASTLMGASRSWQPTPAQQAFIDSVAKLQPQQQVVAVSEKLKELNPGFDGTVKHKIRNRRVVELRFLSSDVTDLSPVRALAHLEKLHCDGKDGGKNNLADLSPLQGMPLTKLSFSNTRVADLSPLQEMPLTYLECSNTRVADLSPLQGMRLGLLYIFRTQIADLSPLQGMPLTMLSLSNTRVTDLSPLQEMPLTYLECSHTRVADLSPLQGMPLTTLYFSHTWVTDLSPLKGMPLKILFWDVRLYHPADEALLKSLPLKTVWNRLPIAEFWEQCDARRKSVEEFALSTTKLPASKQIEAVRARLKKLDATATLRLNVIGNTVTEATLILNDHSTDVTPLMAFTKLKKLTITGGRADWLDISVIKHLPLEELHCSEPMVRKNAPILRTMATLKTINGKPIEGYWKEWNRKVDNANPSQAPAIPNGLSTKWQEVLPTIDLKRDARHRDGDRGLLTFTLKDGVYHVSSDGNLLHGLVIPQLLDDAYELEVQQEFRSVGTAYLVLPVGPRFVIAELVRDRESARLLVKNVDGKASDESMNVEVNLELLKEFVWGARVQRQGDHVELTFSINDNEVWNWSGSIDQIGKSPTVHEQWVFDHSGQAAFLTYDTELLVPSIRLRRSSTNRGNLFFEKPGSYVDVPSVPVDFTKPFCIECWCDPRDLAQTKNEIRVIATFGPCQLSIDSNKFVQAVIVDVLNKKKPIVARQESISAQLEKEQLHIAMQWTGDDLLLFINGVPHSGILLKWKHGENPIAFIKRVTTASTSGQLRIGNFMNEFTVADSEDGHFASSIDSLRVSQGLRYTSKFMPEKFSGDAQTIALYDFHEGKGDVLHDVSGNGHDGEIVGAKWGNTISATTETEREIAE